MYVIVKIFIVFCCVLGAALGVYENNPFINGENLTSSLSKDVNQWNLAVIVPPGKEPFVSQNGQVPPSPPAPGYVWVQVPISNKPGSNQASPGKHPELGSSIPPWNKPPITQKPADDNHEYSTKEPVFTIEPPEVLYGGDLNKNCLKPRGQFPSNACNKFVNCWEGVATEQSCPGSLLFNPLKGYCDYPSLVDCKGKSVVPTITPTPVTVPSYVITSTSSVSNPTPSITSNPQIENTPSLRKFCLKSTGLFPGSKCSSFVNCWNDQAVEQDCPEGLLFSDKGYCDYPQNVKCGLIEQLIILSDDVNEIPAKINPRDMSCPLEFGTFRDKSNCSTYYTCAYNKVAARFECPNGFSFSDLLGVCDYSNRVDCTKEPLIYQRNASFQDEPTIFNAFAHPDLSIPAPGDAECTVSNGIVRDQNNCSSYYVCEAGKVVANYICPTGFKFSDELGVCDYEEKVNCNKPIKMFAIGNNNFALPNIPNEILKQIQNCTPGSVFRLNPQCTSACRCRNGVAEIIQCTAGLAYDSHMDKCVLAHIAKC